MKDLNFYIESTEKRVPINPYLIIGLTIILSIALTISYSILKKIEIRQVSRDLEKLKTIENSERISNRIEELLVKEEEIHELEDYLNSIKLLDNEIEEAWMVDCDFLDIIDSKVYQGMSLSSLTMNSSNIDILGVAENEALISSFTENIKKVDKFNKVFIVNISKKDGFYNFNLNIDLEDVSIDEEEAIQDDFDQE